MKLGVVCVNFGEPDEPTPEKVIAFLERIFLRNASLEGHVDAAAVARAAQLARARAPGLMEAYEAIGGSPLNAQSSVQVEALGVELARRGVVAKVYSAFQFTEPSVAGCVAAAMDDGVDVLVAMPGYPLCGQSTTAAALEDVRSALDVAGWIGRYLAISGWHYHADYLRLRVDHIASYVTARGLDLNATDTLLYFSVHGTPLKYLEEGNRYDRYVFEHCRDLASALGTHRYAVGFQNHGNRRIPWTQPDNERRIRELRERRLVVVPVSFMKEQSETLSELDHELRALVEGLGKEMHRVPVPYDHAAFISYLADLVREVIRPDVGSGHSLSRCRCCPGAGTWCTNGGRELPPSPYTGEP
jgi:ferrochelatase